MNENMGGSVGATPWAKRPLSMIAGIIAIGVLLIAVIMMAGRSTAENDGEVGLLNYPRGPHGARLLSDGQLQLEMTIYESGVEPQFRVYPYDADLRPVSPSDVTLEVELLRLGGRVDRILFRPQAEYLLGTSVVEEPHSFDVKVVGQLGGKRYEWSYSQTEGKVQLDDDQLISAGIVIGTVGPRVMVTTVELPGEIRADETRLAHVVPRLQGVVTDVFKKEGDRVEKGELIAVLSSREFADAKREYLVASRQVAFARGVLDREEILWTKRISAEREYLEAKRAFEEAELTLRLAAQNLVLLGVPESDLAGLATAPAERLARYEIRSPLAGEVVERDLTIGEAVRADGHIFTIADLSTVWADVTVFAKDIAMVRAGQVATVSSSDLGSEISGRVSYVGPLVGKDTRAAIARIVLPNASGRWRPGLFVTVRVVRESVTVPLAVPTDAIQSFRDWQVVFVRSGDWFEARPLELGRSDGTWVEVLSGLRAGDRFAATNSFAVKAEIGKIGATHDH